MRKTYKYALFIVLLIAVAFWSRKAYDYYLNIPIAATFVGSESKVVINVPFYKQDDIRWQKEKLAKQYDTLGASGCTLCCLAMAMDVLGNTKNPIELNNELTELGAYDTNGNIIWKKVKINSGKTIRVIKPDHSAITKSINDGVPVLVKVKIIEGIIHWVLIVGYERGRYLIHDPLVEFGKHKYLDEITDNIDGVRLII